MSSRSSTRNSWLRITSHASVRYWLAWVLCLCAWRGPLPVVHCHAIEALSGPIETNWQLAEHVAVCHASAHEHIDLGWHLHFVMPASGSSKAPHSLPLDPPVLAEVITHDIKGDSTHIDAPLSNQSMGPMFDFAGPFAQPSLSPPMPKLIPLAPPRSRPTGVSPRIYYCVAQC